jgi:HK97 family phage prohead protease
MIHFTTRDAPAVDLTLRVASITPTASGSYEAVLSTNADVQRAGYIERLGEWGTLPARIPLLDSHRHDSIDHVIGHVDQIRAENGTVRGTVHISDSRPDIRQKIADGSISGTSIGFTAQWRDSTENGRRYRVADSITLHEASLVVIPADNGSRLRSLASTLGVPETFVSTLSTRGLTEADMRTAVIAEAARSQPRIDARAHVTHETSPATYARAMGEALAARYGAGNTVSELARPYVNERFPALVRRWSELSNLSTTGMSEATIVRQAMTTSDFPLMLGEFANVSVLQAYRNAPAPILALTRRTTAADFRDIHTLRMGDNPALLEIPESGEIKFGALDESGEAFRLKRWGRGLAISYVLHGQRSVGHDRRRLAHLGLCRQRNGSERCSKSADGQQRLGSNNVGR